MTTRKKIIAAATALTVATGVTATPAQAQTLPVPAANSSVNQGQLVGAGAALAAIVVTLGLIIGSDVRGANKIIAHFRMFVRENCRLSDSVITRLCLYCSHSCVSNKVDSPTLRRTTWSHSRWQENVGCI